MWIFTPHGFFSVVKSTREHEETKLQVRARRLDDLRNFLGDMSDYMLREHGVRIDAKILTTPNADYRYRAILEQSHVAAFIRHLVASIDYRNFKEECGRHRGKNSVYLDALHAVWSVMWRTTDRN